MGETHSKGGKSKGFPKLAKKNLITRWKTRNLSQQFFGVARHDERADGMNSFYNGAIWVQTDDFRNWPFDPPLSDAGLEAARDTGQRMKDITQSSANQLHVIVSSPYLRCVQTAVEICLALGPKTRLLVDHSLGEIFGPTVMGPTVPQSPVRPMAHTLSYCRSRGVSCHPRVIGKWPAWPENIRDARERFANLFLTYLQRANTTQRNFLIVGHADCVAASLSLMPSQADHSIEKVHYGGLFLGKRFRKEEKTLRKPNKLHRKQLVSVVPGDENSGDSDPDTPTLLIGNRSCHDGWLSGDDRNEETIAMFEEQVKLPNESDGWEVVTMNIDLHEKLMQRANSGTHHSTFSKRVSALAKSSRFSRERIETLLGELSSTPLGDVAHEELAKDLVARQISVESDDRVSTRQSLVSFSTFLFGASDIGNMSDIGSEIGSRVPTWTSEMNSRRPSLTTSDAASRLPSVSDLESCPNLSPRTSVRPSARLSTHPRMTKSVNCCSVDSSRTCDDTLEPLDSQSSKKLIEDQVRQSRSSQQHVSCRSLERVDEKNGPAGFSLIANEPSMHSFGCDIVDQKEAGLQNIVESSLWRRRQMQSALSNRCLAQPAQLEKNNEEVGTPAQHATQQLDVEQTIRESITQLRSAVQVQSYQAIPA